MKVKLIKYNGEPKEMDVTLNKIYTVIDGSGFPESVKISDDVDATHALTKDEFKVIEQTPEQKPWYENGELPLAGEITSAQHLDSNLIREVKVMSYQDGYVWLYDQNDYEHLVWVACDVEFKHVKPVKSEKEIEKEKQIEELSDQIYHGMVNKVRAKAIAEHLYNLGYRKVQ